MINTYKELRETTRLTGSSIERMISVFIKHGWKKPLTGKRMENKIKNLEALLEHEKDMHEKTMENFAKEFTERRRLEALINSRCKALESGESYEAMMARERKEHFEKNPLCEEEER